MGYRSCPVLVSLWTLKTGYSTRAGLQPEAPLFSKSGANLYDNCVCTSRALRMPMGACSKELRTVGIAICQQWHITVKMPKCHDSSTAAAGAQAVRQLIKPNKSLFNNKPQLKWCFQMQATNPRPYFSVGHNCFTKTHRSHTQRSYKLSEPELTDQHLCCLL